MKSIKEFDVKFVLSPLDEKEVVSGALGCGCTVYGRYIVVAGSLYVDGIPQSDHIWQDGDMCIQGLVGIPMD